jgi:hypothetical protein
VTPADAIQVALQEVMRDQHKMAEFRYMAHDMRLFTIPSGTQNYTLDDVFQSSVPSKMIIGFLDSSAVNGAYDTYAYNFQHFDVSYLSVNVSGQPAAIGPLRMNYEEGHSLDAYMSLFTQLGLFGRNVGNNISRYDYPRGFTLYAIDLDDQQNTQDVEEVFPATKKGNVRLRLQLRFGKPLPTTVSLCCFALFPKVWRCDFERNIYKS